MLECHVQGTISGVGWEVAGGREEEEGAARRQCGPTKYLREDTKMSYCVTSVRRAVMKETKDGKCRRGCKAIGTLVRTLLVGMQNKIATVEKQY